ncbi:MAG: sigma-70 family RNA polymerase sigma factor [Kiritimatiellae bacterium]|nr:sigma-70 family RNA polymerase sigma factor [Kiritimatiellia bacterium]MDD5523011.1 sigma-70 family RNA polymerase sigma factor [Kiritimatiellia bacterium]
MADKKEREELIRKAIVSGNEKAFDLMWEEYGQMMFGMILSILCSHHDAEEVLQDVFLKIAKNKDSVAEAKNMSGYIYSIARNETMSFLAKRRRVPEPTDPAEFWLVPAKEEKNFKDESVQISKALAELPEEQRTVIVMKIFRDMTFDDIAEAMNVSLNTAASRYRYGMDKLKVLLGDLK